MYNHIRGVIVHKSPSRIVVEASGVGYEVAIPLSVSHRLPPVGKEATVLIHMVVREDEFKLIGFADEAERSLFRKLIDLSGVGPAMALQILSAMPPHDFMVAVERQDAGALKKIKGVGEKTAKRIILELKGAKTMLPPDGIDMPTGAPAEAAAALVALGINQNEALARVAKVLESNPEFAVEDLIKAALR